MLGGLAENKQTEGNTGFSFLPKILTGKSNRSEKTDIIVLLQVKAI